MCQVKMKNKNCLTILVEKENAMNLPHYSDNFFEPTNVQKKIIGNNIWHNLFFIYV